MSVQPGSRQRRTRYMVDFLSSFWSLEVCRSIKQQAPRDSQHRLNPNLYYVDKVLNISVFISRVWLWAVSLSLPPVLTFCIACFLSGSGFNCWSDCLWMMALLPAVISYPPSTAFRMHVSLSLIYNTSLLWPVLVFYYLIDLRFMNVIICCTLVDVGN